MRSSTIAMLNCARNAGKVCLALFATQMACAANDTPTETVETFFAGMATNDWQLASSVLIEDAVLYGYRVSGGEVVLSRLTASEYVDAMSSRSDRLLERIWDVQVLEHDRLATVWTPYDFYLNGEFSHCGRNSFSLIRSDSGWRIASITYSMLKESCETSPLGPPPTE